MGELQSCQVYFEVKIYLNCNMEQHGSRLVKILNRIGIITPEISEHTVKVVISLLPYLNRNAMQNCVVLIVVVGTGSETPLLLI